MKNQNNKPSIAVIGYGRFGKLLAEILKPYGNLFIIEKHQIKNKKIRRIRYRDLATIDWVIPAVPISALEKVLKKINPYLKPGGLVMDVCSVKTYPCRLLKKIIKPSVQTLGTHPMFGPDSVRAGLRGRQIVICPIKISTKNLLKIKIIFKKIGLKTITATPAEHDRQAAKSLALVHYIGRGLDKLKIARQAISTLGFDRLLSVNETVNNDTWQLFFDMHNYNPYAKRIRYRLLEALCKTEEKIINQKKGNKSMLYRQVIDELDNIILKLLKKRFDYARKIGVMKKIAGRTTIDKNRERQMLQNRKKTSSLSPLFVDKLYRVIFDESYKNQQ